MHPVTLIPPRVGNRSSSHRDKLSGALGRAARAAAESLEARLLLSVVPVLDQPFGTAASSPGQIVDLNGTALFTTKAPWQRLWKSDGSVGGTTVLADFGTTNANAPQ